MRDRLVGAAVVSGLRAAAWSLGLCLATGAQAEIDCNAASSGKAPAADVRRVIAYRDSSTALDRDEVRQIQNKVTTTYLDDYMNSLGLDSTSVKRLQFVLCESTKRSETLTTGTDVRQLDGYRVMLVVWRVNDKPIVGHAVIPSLVRFPPDAVDDMHVLSVEQPNSATWLERIGGNRAAFTGLLGLGLGVQYLETGHLHPAKLVLCKSRKDLARAKSSFTEPKEQADMLMGLIDKLLKDAEGRIAAASSPTPTALAQSIRAACAP